jgi:hypothetical protein
MTADSLIRGSKQFRFETVADAEGETRVNRVSSRESYPEKL